MMWLYLKWLTVLLTLATANELKIKQKQLEEEFRSKRQINSIPLVYPYGATYKLLIGISTPVPNLDHINLAFAANFQYQYVQFQNISMLSRYYVYNTVSREQRDADFTKEQSSKERITFYRAAAEMLNSKGFNGVQCILRAICEAAQYPVQEEGLLGEILHIILTPDYGRTPFELNDPDWEEDMSLYVDAATAGRQMFECAYVYSGCPEGQGILELISILKDE